MAVLACPICAADLGVQPSPVSGTGAWSLSCQSCGERYDAPSDIPRFVPLVNYSATFGFQWNRFAGTQLDSRTGLAVSRERFFRQTGWKPTDLEGRLVLDVGCGAGRFAEIVLADAGKLVAVDFSSAVEACRANLSAQSMNLLALQADIHHLPLRAGSFDFIYCFGVLQHTPDPASAFAALPKLLKPGGRLAIDVYPWLWRNLLWPKYWLRPVTRRLPTSFLFAAVERCTPLLLPFSRMVGRVPRIGRWLRHVIPVANYEGIYPLSTAQLREWAVLDTFDMLSPAHDHPQTARAIGCWLRAAGLENIEVFRDGFLVARGRMPARTAQAV
jgi:SAM-dependent methyltransferase